MKRILTIVILSFSVLIGFGLGYAGEYGSQKQASEIDYTLMGFKESGVWYFLCTAPQYPVRTVPSYVTYGPPPPCMPPAACAPQPNGKRR